jgi:predicted nucleotidyltransferase
METVSEVLGVRGGISKKAYRDLLSFKDAVQGRFGVQVKSLILFGSRARLEARKDSDFDVAVIMHSANVGSESDRLLSKLAYPFLLKGTFISAFSMPENLKRQAQSNLLAHSILHEGLEIV